MAQAGASVSMATQFNSAFQTWGAHLLALAFPVSTLLYLASGPHSFAGTALGMLVIATYFAIDHSRRESLQQPAADLPHWAFEIPLYIATTIHFLNLGLFFYFLLQSQSLPQPLFLANAFVGTLFTGLTAGGSGIVLAHELIHRPQRHWQFLGRAILVSTLYEHFSTEHVRGHHALVATGKDPATARFGERFWPFYRRTVPAQFKSAWAIELKRTRTATLPWWHIGHLRNRVLQGVIAQIVAVVGLTLWLGWMVALGFVVQGFIAFTLLEVVNYFEHWGLTRRGKKVLTEDSWDTDSLFSRFSLFGLSRHADHHAYASRPFYQLRHMDESPKLPHGYYAMILMVLFRNKAYRDYCEAELRRKKLGPFRPEAAHSRHA